MGDQVPEEIVVPLHAEEAQVERRLTVGDTVTVRVVTRPRQVSIDEQLASERVEIERVEIGTVIDEHPDVRHEGDVTIVPIVEEVLVTERRLILKEEVRIRRIRTVEHHTQTVTVREQDVVVTRTGPAAPDET